MMAYQRAETPGLWKRLAHRRAQARENATPAATLFAGRYERQTRGQSQLTRSLVLKEPGAGGERGVLLVQFEYNWYRLAKHPEVLRTLASTYDVLWGTSWSPTDYGLLETLLGMTEGAFYVLPSHANEGAKLETFHPRIHCPPVLSACDWVDSSRFAPKPFSERRTDVLMVANWAPFKRHHALFAALRDLPAELRVTLIGQPEGKYTADHIRAMMRDFGVPQQVQIFESLPLAEVAAHQCDTKVALILSMREGSCVAAVEAMFAGAALGLQEGSHVGAMQYVNPHTGGIISHRHAARDLEALLQKAGALDPRRWAQENISSEGSWLRLNADMAEHAKCRGLPWIGDLVPFHWSPYPTHRNREDRERLRRSHARLHELSPELFAADLIETSHR
jgi:hypothetical protein